MRFFRGTQPGVKSTPAAASSSESRVGMSRPDRPCGAGAAVATGMRASSIPEMRHYFTREQRRRPFHVSLTNHTRVDLQRSGFETARTRKVAARLSKAGDETEPDGVVASDED